jgi:hypothetical protein
MLPWLWWQWVPDYHSRQLSRLSDRLPAFAGITRLYQEKTGDTPVIGLWQKDLHIHLTWALKECKMLGHEGPQRNKPTWSWIGLGNAHIDPPIMFRHEFGSRKSTNLADIVNVDISWSGHTLTSATDRAVITIRGEILRWKIKRNEFSQGKLKIGETDPLDKKVHFETKDGQSNILFDDSADWCTPMTCDYQEERIVFLPLWARCVDGVAIYHHGIIIRPTGQRAGEHYRIGVFNY